MQDRRRSAAPLSHPSRPCCGVPGREREIRMIREDTELLAELARLNTDITPFCLRIMEGSAGAAEQAHYAERLIATGERLRRRAEAMSGTVIEGEVVPSAAHKQSVALPSHTVEPVRRP